MDNKYKIYLLTIAAGMTVLAGCTADGPSPEVPAEEPAPEQYIRIASGGASTRAEIKEPNQPGQCNADQMYIWKFRGVDYLGTSLKLENIEFYSQYDITVEHYTDPDPSNGDRTPYYQSDKWARKNDMSLHYDASRKTWFAFPALAFTKADAASFTVSYEGKYENMSLSLAGYNTPELYFGRLKPHHQDLTDHFNTDDKSGATDAGNFYQDHDYDKCSLYGTLYRIVSQLNINIDNVNKEAVSKMEMWVSNVPNKIGLYAPHSAAGSTGVAAQGFYYPIVAAKEDDHATGESGWIKVDEMTRLSKKVDKETGTTSWTASMSSFFLPSEKGRSVKIRIFYNKGYMNDINGKPLEYKDYDVKAPKTYYINNENVMAMYYANEPMKIYDLPDNLFFSYSNIRVNLNGPFENFFPERSDVELGLEICPSYDGEHKYTIN